MGPTRSTLTPPTTIEPLNQLASGLRGRIDGPGGAPFSATVRGQVLRLDAAAGLGSPYPIPCPAVLRAPGAHR